MTRPVYIPKIVWDAANHFLGAESWQGSTDAKHLRNLLEDASLDPTWKRLCKSLKTEQQWCIFLDLVVTLPISLDSGLRSAIEKAESIHKEIGDLASTLSEKIEDYIDLANRHCLECPSEFGNLLELIHKSADEYPDFKWWQRYTADRKINTRFPDLGTIEPKYQIPPAALIRHLQKATFHHWPEPMEESQGYALEGKSTFVGDYIRHFDDRLCANYEHYFPSGFTVSDTDLARILSSLLKMEIKRENVAMVRRRRKT